jgi:hypothetical protein
MISYAHLGKQVILQLYRRALVVDETRLHDLIDYLTVIVIRS